MKHGTAPTSLTIKLISAGVLLLNVGFYVVASYQRAFLPAAIVITVSALICYWFWTPVAYEVVGDELIVSFRIGRKRYRPFRRCSVVASCCRWTFRLLGDGGLFASSGIFWNRQWGVFRAYVTTSKPGTLVLVETNRTKILISPEDPKSFVELAQRDR